MSKTRESAGENYSRDRKLEVSCLNLVLHPHSQELYIALLKTIHANKLDIKVRGDDAVMLGSVFKGEEGDVYVGEIFKFLKLNAAEDWFNTLSMEVASRNDVSGIVIPENLKPHFKRFQYAFFPSKHRLFYVSRSGSDALSPGLLKKFFEGAAESAALAEFGSLTVTVEPRIDSTEQIFSIPRISRLEMEINKPNPDDLAGLDVEMQERLRRLNAKKEIVILVEANTEGLQPDDELKALADVAASNGKVYAKGRDVEGSVIKLSTESMPMAVPVTFNPDLQAERDALVQAARELMPR